MSDAVFLPGLDGAAESREGFLAGLRRRHSVRATSPPNRRLGSIASYRDPAMAETPVDRSRWSAGFTRALGSLDDAVVAERMRTIATEDVTRLPRFPLAIRPRACALAIERALRGRGAPSNGTFRP